MNLADAVAFLNEAGAGRVYHHGGTLLDHLVATNRLLWSWGCPEHVVTAGTFHSFYSWLARPTDRSRAALRGAIGAAAEELVFVFDATDPAETMAATFNERTVRLTTSAGVMTLPLHAYADLLWLDRANTEDLMERYVLTPEQIERLEERSRRTRALLQSLSIVRDAVEQPHG
jgi:hypothetical protein